MKRIVNPLGKLNWRRRACAVLVLCATTAIALPAQTFTPLHSFGGPDGGMPKAALIQGADGNLYGTTSGGGTHGSGTVFKIAPRGTLTTLTTSALELAVRTASGLPLGSSRPPMGTSAGQRIKAGSTAVERSSRSRRLER